MAPAPSQCSLRLSCGPSTSNLKPLAPNTSTPTALTPAPPGMADIQLKVFIDSYRGQPEGTPSTHAYFEHPSRKGELYALRIDFTPAAPINGDDLVLGNDFDRPIRDRLPFWFGGAWRALQLIDPGIEGDVYADRPGIFGRVLGSVNVLAASEAGGPSATPPADPVEQAGDVILEALAGGPETAEKVPADPAARRKFFLSEERRKKFVFQPGRRYRLDFGNGFIDFNEFGLKLPGFKVSVLKYWDGQPLRYTLKNRKTDEVYAVVVFELLEEGNGKGEKEAEAGKTKKEDNEID